jgi:hypothetical protein
VTEDEVTTEARVRTKWALEIDEAADGHVAELGDR